LVPARAGRHFLCGDVAALVCALLVVALVAARVYGGARGVPAALIEGAGGTWIYPLDGARVVRVSGPLGESVVALENGSARFVSSPCRNQTCITMGSVHARGQWLACLPNAVLVLLEDDGGAAENVLPFSAQSSPADAGTW
jgi:hypothetical protein